MVILDRVFGDSVGFGVVVTKEGTFDGEDVLACGEVSEESVTGGGFVAAVVAAVLQSEARVVLADYGGVEFGEFAV